MRLACFHCWLKIVYAVGERLEEVRRARQCSTTLAHCYPLTQFYPIVVVPMLPHVLRDPMQEIRMAGLALLGK